MNDYLSNVYYDPKRSGWFGGAERLYNDVRKEEKYRISYKQIK